MKVNLNKLMNTILAFENCKENYINLYNADFLINNNINIISNNDNKTSKIGNADHYVNYYICKCYDALRKTIFLLSCQLIKNCRACLCGSNSS